MSEDQVTIYSASWCAYCHATKEYLNKLGVKYTDKDVEKDLDAANEVISKSGQRGIPVVDINGTIVVGFDRMSINQALKDAHLI